MSMLVFLLEEPSAEEMLKGILPQILPSNITPKFMVFEGKQDLDKRLERRVRNWQMPDTSFVVLRDQDSGNCIQIKQGLKEKLENARRPDSLVRIACHELESFYLGDLSAVETGLGVPKLSREQNRAKFRTPDTISRPSEELAKIAPQYQKVAGSRAISPHLKLDGTNSSHSFNVLITGLRTLASRMPK
ncbi:DUF4276 family protein [Aeoliella mucimassa]|uniref:DUF4276 domain-containing protein n=1 Tax=Aeoliella mucimassa TaxID=2527972 RepID=A0A518AI65_9BACT|nr:DUF4276 family protein [Aeoliella mucimassa]QDU54418.1 hypothetical protein Pan181_05990 [Aeoliella mucimassa]